MSASCHGFIVPHWVQLSQYVHGAGQMPEVRQGKKGAVYLKTKGGNTVGARVDESGRTYMFDRAGNLYYDTGDRRLGFYIVRLICPSTQVASAYPGSLLAMCSSGSKKDILIVTNDFSCYRCILRPICTHHFNIQRRNWAHEEHVSCFEDCVLVHR